MKNIICFILFVIIFIFTNTGIITANNKNESNTHTLSIKDDMKLIENEIDKYKRNNRFYKEFLSIEKFLDKYYGYADREKIQNMILRAYEIGKHYYTTKIVCDKALKIFESILKYVNDENICADIKIYIAEIVYFKQWNIDKAFGIINSVIDNPTISDEKRIYAYQSLIDCYMSLVKQNRDYDNNKKKVTRLLKQLSSKYPDNEEIQTYYVEKNINKLNELDVKKLFQKAIFYKQRRNEKAANKYFDIIKNKYSNTKYYKKVNKLLPPKV
jgi:hypothetical protein